MVVWSYIWATSNYLHKRGHKGCIAVQLRWKRKLPLAVDLYYGVTSGFVPLCCQCLQNGVGLSYQSLCQNISLQVQSERDHDFHSTHKLLMKTWINGQSTRKLTIEHRGRALQWCVGYYCSSCICTVGEVALGDHLFKFHVQANTACKCVFRAALLLWRWHWRLLISQEARGPNLFFLLQHWCKSSWTAALANRKEAVIDFFFLRSFFSEFLFICLCCFLSFSLQVTRKATRQPCLGAAVRTTAGPFWLRRYHHHDVDSGAPSVTLITQTKNMLGLKKKNLQSQKIFLRSPG